MKKQIKNKRFYRLFLVLAFIFATTLTSSNLISATYAEEIEYAVEIVPVLNLTIPTSSIALNLHPYNKPFDSGDLNISVGTNSPHGYKVLVSSSGTSLVNTEDATKVIETLPTLSGGYTDDSFVVNKWGIKKDSGNWNPYVSGATLLENTEPTNIDTTTLAIGTKIDYTQASGIYNLALTFNAIANVATSNLSIVFSGTGVDNVKVCATLGDCTGTDLMGTITTSGDSVTGLLDGTTYYLYPTFTSGYELGSWANTGSYGTLSSTSATNPGFTMGRNNGKVTISGCSSTISGDMQSFSPCSGLTGYGSLTDSRDGQTYVVSKLSDGKWWLLDNLRLGSQTLVQALTTSNTNMSPNVAFTLPASISSGFGSYTDPQINTDFVNTVNDDDSENWGIGTHKYGVYYNYCAASAGTYCMDELSGSGDASYDICPKGWKMPSSGSSVSGDYPSYLDGTEYLNYRDAFSPPLSGDFYDDSAEYQGEYGYFWSSTIDDEETMDELRVTVNDIATSGDTRDYGLPVRCVLK